MQPFCDHCGLSEAVIADTLMSTVQIWKAVTQPTCKVNRISQTPAAKWIVK